MGCSIFSPDKTPKGFHDKKVVNKKGETVTYGSIDAVYKWACDPKQKDLFDGIGPTCMSHYGLCE